MTGHGGFDLSSEQHSLILRPIARSSAGIWCLICPETRQVTLCSQSFLDFWNLSGDVDEIAVRGLAEAEIAAAKLSDLWSDWLPSLSELISIAAGELAETDRDPSLAELVRCEEVLDDQQQRVGRLLVITPPAICCLPPKLAASISRVSQRLRLLSEREREILQLVCDGLTSTAVAARLGISHKTVEKHRASIMDKLQFRSVAELVRGATLAQLLVR